MPVLSTKLLFENRVRAIRALHPRAEVDVSGGVDSFVVLGLCVAALGTENVTAVYSGIHSSEDSAWLALRAACAFNTPLISLELSPWFDDLKAKLFDAIEKTYGHEMLAAVEARCKEDPTILGSIRSCLRAPIGRGVNRLMGNGIRHGTGNECEDRIVRFYQKGGDGEVDTNPIGMLTKGEVYQLALYLGEHFDLAGPAAHEIIASKPAPDLWGSGEAHNDEDEYSSWLGVELPKDLFWYSYIDLATGKYTNVGVLERVARLCDTSIRLIGWWGDHTNTFGHFLFAEAAPKELRARLYALAPAARHFIGVPEDKVVEILRALVVAERSTRHKENPNISSLGSREELVEAGILTDNLPV